MEKKAVESKVKTIIARILNLNSDTISNEANFIFDLGADSQQSIELVAAFEEEFNIEMDSDKALEIQTVSGAVNFISQHLN
ncbi:MAG: acyl carrier protein [Spirochaetes bacterium]|nr:acyl carrier protein [Spirochaetota bacterium]